MLEPWPLLSMASHSEMPWTYLTLGLILFFLMRIGEVYVLNDGGEVDLDLGNYERYLNVTLSRDNNITTGKVYREVIDKEASHCGLLSPGLTR